MAYGLKKILNTKEVTNETAFFRQYSANLIRSALAKGTDNHSDMELARLLCRNASQICIYIHIT